MIINTIPLLDSAQRRPDLLEHVHAIVVTPALAQQWLARNTHNRGLKPTSIDRFSTDMREDEWQWNGGTICWSEDGVPLDGQNRLHAIVEAGVDVPMLIVGDLPNDAQRDIDTGISRKLGDVLTLRKEPNATSLAALIRVTSMRVAVVRSQLIHRSKQHFCYMPLLDPHPSPRDNVNPT